MPPKKKKIQLMHIVGRGAIIRNYNAKQSPDPECGGKKEVGFCSVAAWVTFTFYCYLLPRTIT